MTVPPAPAFGPGSGAADPSQPAALAALVKILQADGSTLRLGSNDTWQAHLNKDDNWQSAAAISNLD